MMDLDAAQPRPCWLLDPVCIWGGVNILVVSLAVAESYHNHHHHHPVVWGLLGGGGRYEDVQDGGHFPEAECLPLSRNSLKLVVCLEDGGGQGHYLAKRLVDSG